MIRLNERHHIVVFSCLPLFSIESVSITLEGLVADASVSVYVLLIYEFQLLFSFICSLYFTTSFTYQIKITNCLLLSTV